MQIEIPDNLVVPLGRNGCFGTLYADITKFTPAVHLHVYEYGLRQILNDKISDKTDKEGNELSNDELEAKAQTRLDTLYSGELRQRSGPGLWPTDPIESELWRLAKERMVIVYRKLPLWKTIPKGTKDRFCAMVQLRRTATHREELPDDEAVKAAIESYIDANPALREIAERNVAEQREMRNAADDLVDGM